MTVSGQTLIIVNNPALAYELLEKRSARHSSRPKQHFAREIYVALAQRDNLQDAH